MVQRITATAITDAPPHTVYELLRNPQTWTAWSTMDDVVLEKPAVGEPNGVGSVRRLTRGRVIGFDEVAELVPDRRFGYVHLRGLPVRDYRADVDLEPVEGGTRIHWHATFRRKTPGTGWLLRITLGKFLREITQGLAIHAASLQRAGRS